MAFLLLLEVALEEGTKLSCHFIDFLIPSLLRVAVAEVRVVVAGQALKGTKDEAAADGGVFDDAEPAEVIVQSRRFEEAVEEVELHGMAEVVEAGLTVCLIIII